MTSNQLSTILGEDDIIEPPVKKKKDDTLGITDNVYYSQTDAGKMSLAAYQINVY